MDLETYLFKTKQQATVFRKSIDVEMSTIHNYKKRKHSPKLLAAIKIFVLSDGDVSFIDLLSYEEKKELENWLQEKNLTL